MTLGPGGCSGKEDKRDTAKWAFKSYKLENENEWAIKKCPQNVPKTIPKCSQNDPKMTPK